MCGKTPKTPKVVQRDPEAEQRRAEAEAAMKANAETAQRRRRRGGGAIARAVMDAVASAKGSQQAASLLQQAQPKG